VVPALAVVASGLVVAAVVAVALLAVHRSAGTHPAAGAQGGPLTLIYRADPTPGQLRVTRSALDRTISLIEARARMLGVSNAHVHRRGADEIVVRLADVRYVSRAESVLGSQAQLEFFDWEANVLLPDGKSVASNVRSIASRSAPGTPGAGGMSLYAAVKLASGQPRAPLGPSLSRLGDEYYLFGAPGSASCAAAASDVETAPVAGQHCALAGPEPSLNALRSDDLPNGVTFSDGHVLEVPQGWVVLQAASPTASVPASPLSSTARYYVLRDHPGVPGAQLLRVAAIRLNGQPSLEARFTANGAQAFQRLTKLIADRGQMISTPRKHLFQHFAIEVDGQLLAVPQIDFRVFPFGDVATHPAYIQGPFTARTAQTLAAQIPVRTLALKLIARRP
jgi:SecD/SecF fusion protein